MLTKTIQGDTILYRRGEDTVLSIEEADTGEGVLLTVRGELRSQVSHDFRDELMAFATSGAPVTVDLSGVTYLANAIQDDLVSVQQCIDQMGAGALLLRCPGEQILRELQSTGIIDCLDIQP